MAVIQKKTNELESMMASFAAIPDFEKAGTDLRRTNVFKIRRNNFMAIFITHRMAFAASRIFLSIIIEALPFVLLGSILSSFIEVFVLLKKVQNFLPKNKSLAISLWNSYWFYFPSCECGIVLFQLSRLLEKKCLATRLFLSWQLLLSLIQSFSLRPIRPLGTLILMAHVSSGLS